MDYSAHFPLIGFDNRAYSLSGLVEYTEAGFHRAGCQRPPAITRPLDDLRSRLLVGSAENCVSKLSAYSAAVLQRVLVWPVADEVRQLELFMERVAPSV